MRLAPMLLITAVAIGGACTSERQTTADAPVVNATTSGTAKPVEKANQAELCVHTDPAKQPISVHRALACPDGTQVWVRGVVVGGSGASVLLCDDAASSDNCLTIAGGVLPTEAPSSPGSLIFYTGTVSKGILSVRQTPFAENGGTVVPSPFSRPSVPPRSA